MVDGRRKVVNWLIEMFTKFKMDDVGRETINWLIELSTLIGITTDSEVSDVTRKVINLLIKMFAK
jgi:hypothetical protein